MKRLTVRTLIPFFLCVLFSGSVGFAENSDMRSTVYPSSMISVESPQYLVRYSCDETYFRFALGALGGTVENLWPELRVANISNLTDDQVTELAGKSFILRLVRDVVVHWVNALSPNLNVRVQAAADATAIAKPSDAEFYDIQWGLQQIHAGDAWKISRGNRAVRVGILDTGISPDHVDLAGKYDLDASINLSASDRKNPQDYIDRHYHGTHVSALIASNNLGVASVAPDVTLVGIKVLDDEGNASFATLINGIMYAVDKAHVSIINLSLGGVGELLTYRHHAEMLHQAIDYAESSGVVVIAAAGNNSMDLREDMLRTFVTTDEAGTLLVSACAPASPDGAVDLACYSNYGAGLVSLAAPGGSIDCAEGSYASMSDMVISAMAPAVARRLGLKNPTGWYMFSSGTSMAAPIVSGVAALVKSVHPEMRPSEIVNRLEATADDLGPVGRDSQFGYGRVNAVNALR